MFRALCVILGLSSVAAVGLHRDPKGAGIAEDTKALACDECAKHKDYLDSTDECVCFASDIMGTFENDATKTSTKRVGKSSGSGEGTHTFKDETSNIGAARLPEGWMWHCRPITGTEGVWQQC
eukprot:gnl/MRDRNA2_/MRDRNA2_28988_c0_seq2.p1 gnl/MRDRNA2_/MRDRNA2_28988_c0~~gnl/MRDRNA2_/MRDRNA2_28988_c0_seq2.p1  ORF type:complete len:123 (+),score=27.61 gnl/MRDRNA2_/MRDRNA2_28988_c0_seq2:76-444(+)